jgi:apolipoprotein N-acyltransferase
MLAWVALVPLLAAVERASPAGVAAAATAYAVTVYVADAGPWLVPAMGAYFGLGPPWALAAGVATPLVVGGALGTLLALALVARRASGRGPGVVWYAATWAAWEALRTVVPPYFPAAVLGTSQHGMLPVLQLASVTGIGGVTALVVAVNAAVAGLWHAAVPRRRRLRSLASAVGLAAGVAVWGSTRLAGTVTPTPGVEVLTVDVGARQAADGTLERYVAATPRRSDPRRALVVWPESALTVDLERDRAAWHRLRGFVDEQETALLAGGVGGAVGSDGEVVRFNSVHFLRPGHGMLSYHKVRLVPLAEWWPAVLGAPPAWLAPVAAGRDLAVFGDEPATFAPVICFEITDAAMVRALVARGARFLVNPSNDAWYGTRGAPHLVWAVVRAIESGRAVVRAANAGTSAIVDPVGRIVASARADGSPAVIADSVPGPVDAVYVRTGEVFLPVCLLLLLAGVTPRRLTGSRSRRFRSCPS